MKAIAQSYQEKRDDVMERELFEILPWLLQLQAQYDGLLGPVACLQ